MPSSYGSVPSPAGAGQIGSAAPARRRSALLGVAAVAVAVSLSSPRRVGPPAPRRALS